MLSIRAIDERPAKLNVDSLIKFMRFQINGSLRVTVGVLAAAAGVLAVSEDGLAVATDRRVSLSLLISFVVLVIVLGTIAPLVGRWRKRKILERTGTSNLSFTKEAISDRDKPELRKVA